MLVKLHENVFAASFFNCTTNRIFENVHEMYLSPFLFSEYLWDLMQ